MKRRKVGRPRGQPLPARATIRMTREEHRHIRRRAAEAGVPINHYMRKVLAG